tara:strand:+ start:500 stop:814 length:315 start_codon:yes stop_codon:yes gene_type:complete
MAQLNSKIIKYLDREVDFRKDVLLQDDGNGSYIKEWNVAEAQPTDAQLNALESEADILENNATAVSNRQKEYGTVAKQIEFITEKGLEAWKTNVQAIKTKYPKE